jgi:hypothetical protein
MGRAGAKVMGELSKREDEWQAKATAAAVAGARKIATHAAPLMNTPVGRISDREWGMIVTAVIFAWIETRMQQAVAEGRNGEEAVRTTGLSPDPCDTAVVRSILPELADTADIDWQLPLMGWSQDQMINFLLLAWRLMSAAEHARDHGSEGILRKAEFDATTGDPIPF